MRARRRAAAALILLTVVTSVDLGAQAQSRAPDAPDAGDKDHAIVFELGGSAGWSKSEGFQPGGTVAFEVTPIERWLELESGVTVVRKNGVTETTVDLLFKKPWPISHRFDFMVGAGPELIHSAGPASATFWGASAVADFMFWPRRNVGWYLEPGYEVTFPGGSARHGIGIEAGLLIGR